MRLPLLIMLMASLPKSKAFNPPTILAVGNYLAQHEDTLTWTTKEDGFVRAELPLSLLQPDAQIEHFNRSAPFARLRTNFWYPFANATLRRAQELNTPHTHRAHFASAIINGGYSHDLFQESPSDECPESEQYTKEKIDRHELKVGSEGTVCLRKVRHDRVIPGDFVYYHTSAIHQLRASEPKALSLNAVARPTEAQIDIYSRGSQEGEPEADVALSQEQNRQVTRAAFRFFAQAQKHTRREQQRSIIYGQQYQTFCGR